MDDPTQVKKIFVEYINRYYSYCTPKYIKFIENPADKVIEIKRFLLEWSLRNYQNLKKRFLEETGIEINPVQFMISVLFF